MTAGGNAAPANGTEWFREWFGEDYLAIYPHRNAEEAERVVKLVRRLVGQRKVHRVLDLACGAGRHARFLRKHWWTVGYDLSAPLLHLARHDDPHAPYVRGDIRSLPFREESFSLVVNLFTSFGYFTDDAEHERALAMAGGVTHRDGMFVLDYLNADQVARTLKPYDEKVVGDIVVEQRRSITSDGRFVEKHITLRDRDKSFIERVRLFSRSDLERMLSSAGFEIERVIGDYSGADWTPESKRTLL